MPTLLLIDDDPSIPFAFQRAFREPAFTVLTAGSATEGLETLTRHRPDVVILDIYLGDATGLDTFHRIRRLDPDLPVILITGHGTTDLAIEAIKHGAFDYLLKPLELPALRELVARACAARRPAADAAPARPEPTTPEAPDALVGRCAAMQEVYKAIGRVAPQDVNVLILGESGTGKELVARAIHQHSHRAAGPFLALNCAAIPEALLESELFGHEKGAFTGAERRRIGKFEQGNGGTLFLDEVGDMTPLTQTKILRVLQEQRFERVGGSEPLRTDARLIAATNADLERLVATARFRSDLYFRLRVFTIRLPPLRERGDDLALLADHLVRRYSRELRMAPPQIAAETLAALLRHDWPGNVRELQSVLLQALLHLHGPVLRPEHLPANLLRPLPPADTAAEAATEPDWDRFVQGRLAAGSEDLYAESLALMERRLLTRVLRHTGGNQVQAARILGITRGSLRTKLRALHINIGRAVWSDNGPTGGE
jgi:two-component system nitrogen regulation response regulator GlnG